jgi:hypothetical protein
MLPAARDLSALAPFPYHRAVVDYLREHERAVWAWASARSTVAEQRKSLRALLLRDTYRLDAQAHAQVHATLSTAMERLGITAPATLYQSASSAMNASLIFVPGEVHIVLQGALLERMAGDELLAVFGHELSHYLLWSRDDGQYLVADRILNDATGNANASRSQQETYRRFALHTELFADRGGAVAAGGVAATIAALVKVQTGIGAVDADAYLRQAVEVEAKEEGASDAQSHPETFIRARAVALWWEGAQSLDAWIALRLHGRLALERLDLVDQWHLQSMTRGFLAHFTGGQAWVSEAVLAQVRMLFPDWSGNDAPVGPEAFDLDSADDSVRHLLNALMLDLALADPDVQDAALLRAGLIAQTLGSFEEFLKHLQRDAGFGKRELDRYKRQLAKEARP